METALFLRYLEIFELREKTITARAKGFKARRLAAKTLHGSAWASETSMPTGGAMGSGGHLRQGPATYFPVRVIRRSGGKEGVRDENRLC
jgi:hypothetical protein